MMYVNNQSDYSFHFNRERPRINSQTVDLDYLRTLPEEAFGRQYMYFLEKNVCSIIIK